MKKGMNDCVLLCLKMKAGDDLVISKFAVKKI